MQHITERGQLFTLARKLVGSANPAWGKTLSVDVVPRGAHLTGACGWGREAEGNAAVGFFDPAGIQRYLVITTGATPLAEVSLTDVLDWASAPDPAVAAEIATLTAELRAAKAALRQQELIIAGDEDLVTTWPMWVDYEDDTNCAEVKQLRCMADVRNGSKILPGGKAATRSCRCEIDGGSITEIAASLRLHITQVEHFVAAASNG